MSDDRIPGGCDQCEAYQTVEDLGPGAWRITVHHDDDCPTLAQRTPSDA